jgi:hypothetical protein
MNATVQRLKARGLTWWHNAIVRRFAAVLAVVSAFVLNVLGAIVTYARETSAAIRRAHVRRVPGAVLLRKVRGRLEVALRNSTAFFVEMSWPRRIAFAVLLLSLMIAKPPAALAMGAIRHANSLAYFLLNVPVADAGRRTVVQIDNAKATRFIDARIAVTFDIAVANGVAVRNLGLAESIFEEIGVMEAGRPVMNGDGRAMFFSSNYQLGQDRLANDRLTSPNIGTYSLNSFGSIWFENPKAVIPKETLFLEKDIRQRLEFFVKLSTVLTGAATSHAGSGRLLQGNATTSATFTSIVIRLTQRSDSNVASVEEILFRPRTEQQNWSPAAAGANQRIEIPIGAGQLLRGLTIIQDSTAGFDSSIITELQLRGDNFEYIGLGAPVAIGNLQRMQTYESGGDTFALYGANAYHYDFQKAGRLASCYNATQDSNLRLVVTVGAVPAGATIIILRHLLERDAAVGFEGRRVVAEKLPAELAA